MFLFFRLQADFDSQAIENSSAEFGKRMKNIKSSVKIINRYYVDLGDYEGSGGKTQGKRMKDMG